MASTTRSMILRFLIGSIAALVPLGSLRAEEAQATLDLEARKASVANLETHIAQREQRLAEWAADIVALDSRIEKRLDELVKLLAGLRDSQESRRSVTQLKKEAIEGLQNGIDIYRKKRAEVRELVRTGDESALGDLDKFDERITTRVDQIATLAQSIPTHVDVEKYEHDEGSSYWNGYYYESSRVSEEWRQNRRDTTAADQVRDQATEALRAALERLDQRRRALDDTLKRPKLSDSERDLYTRELGQIDAYKDHLQARLGEVATATGGGGQAVGREQAHDFELLLEDSRRDLREDVARLFRVYDQFVRGRAYLEGLKENLAQRKEWLGKHAGGDQ